MRRQGVPTGNPAGAAARGQIAAHQNNRYAKNPEDGSSVRMSMIAPTTILAVTISRPAPMTPTTSKVNQVYLPNELKVESGNIQGET